MDPAAFHPWWCDSIDKAPQSLGSTFSGLEKTSKGNLGFIRQSHIHLLPLQVGATVLTSSLNSHLETQQKSHTCHQVSRHKSHRMKQPDTGDREKKQMPNLAAKRIFSTNLRTHSPPQRCPSHIYTKNQLIQEPGTEFTCLGSYWQPMTLKDGKSPLEPISGSSRDVSAAWMALESAPTHLSTGSNFVSPLSPPFSGFQNKIKYKSISSPPPSAQKRQPEAVLQMLFTCPLTNAKAISCQLSDALTFPLLAYRRALQRQGLSIQSRTSQPKQWSLQL